MTGLSIVGTENVEKFGEKYPPETLAQLFKNVCREIAGQEAIIFKEKRITYKELYEESSFLARGLMKLGVKKGDKVALVMGNCPEWIYTEMAVALLGGVFVPLNTRLKTRDLAYVLRQSDTQSLIIQDNFLNIDFVSLISQICPEIQDSQPGFLASPHFPELRNVICFSESNKRYPGFFNFGDVKKSGFLFAPNDELEHIADSIYPDDLWAILYTSGTTGFPKGAMATHYNLVSAGKAAADRYEYKKGEKVLITLPLFHTFGMQLGVQVSLARRLTMVLVDYFNAQEVLRLIDKEKIASVPSVPTVHADLVYHPDVKNYDISTWKLRTGTMGGSEVPPKLVRDMGEILGAHEMLNGHGMTEQCGLACSCFCSDPVDIVAEFNGKPLDCCEYRIVDPKTWETLPLGQEGEICIRGLNVVKGYYKKPEETSAAYEPDGWFHTGDRGFIHHEHKNVKMVGRIKDIFIVGGENVAPREIEELLFEHPKISQAYVVGVPDRRLGEVGMAFVQLKEAVNLTESEVVDYCKGKIANYKVPRYVKFVTEFPMTSTGKIQKFILREIGEKDVSKLSGT